MPWHCHSTVSINCDSFVPFVIRWMKKLPSHAFITRLNYCKRVLSGIIKILLHKLQSVLNAATRLVSKLRKFDHITSTFDLHWFSIEQRVDQKVRFHHLPMHARYCAGIPHWVHAGDRWSRLSSPTRNLWRHMCYHEQTSRLSANEDLLSRDQSSGMGFWPPCTIMTCHWTASAENWKRFYFSRA